MLDFMLMPAGCIYGECIAGRFRFDTKTGRNRLIPLPGRFHVPTNVQEAGLLSINRHWVAGGPNGQIVVFGDQSPAL